MSNRDVKQTMKAIRFRLGMSVKLIELSEAVADYYGSEPSVVKLPGIKLARCYGFQTEPKRSSERLNTRPYL